MPNREELLQRLEKIATDVGVEIDSLINSFEAFVKKELSADETGNDEQASVTTSNLPSDSDSNSQNTVEAQTAPTSDSDASSVKDAADGEGSSTDSADKSAQAVS